MYNFLDPKLMPKVLCKSPMTEHYEVENLINPNEAIRARGFLSYAVTKPPVEIEFEFLCPINISYIFLNTCVGMQRCSGIEVFARNSKCPYTSIGKAVYNSSNVIFCNSRKFSNANPPPCYDGQSTLFYFKSNKFRMFMNTSAIKIVIFRTERAVPCLGSVKVIGEVSRICSPQTVDTINRIMEPPLSLQQCSIDEKDERNSLKIPSDFIDDLTYEVMTIPFTLPSGKTVDRDTLEKYIENEKSFGRKPGDPFTGYKFTETRKPILNVPLKSRIDMFMIRNSENPVTYGMKRTLGGVNGPGWAINNDSKRIKCSSVLQTDKKCVNCNNTDILYVIPCEHLYCRSCLLILNTCRCQICNQEFTTNTVSRFYS